MRAATGAVQMELRRHQSPAFVAAEDHDLPQLGARSSRRPWQWLAWRSSGPPIQSGPES